MEKRELQRIKIGDKKGYLHYFMVISEGVTMGTVRYDNGEWDEVEQKRVKYISRKGINKL